MFARLPQLVVADFCFCIFSYGTAMMHSGYYAGAWPIFLYYSLFFICAVLLPIKAGLNATFLKSVAIILAFPFAILFAAQAQIKTPREVLFIDGLPTLRGAIAHSTLCIGIALFAVGLSALIRDVGKVEKK